MTPKKMMLLALGAASLAAPAAASAQSYEQPYYGGPYGEYRRPADSGSRGDDDRWRGRRFAFQGYPEFRGLEMHIRREIEQAARDDMIEPDDAHDLVERLRQIQFQEAREFNVHGWNLPDDDRYRLRAQLDRLDHTVDEVRDEP